MSEEISAVLERIKEKLAREARLCCSLEGTEEPIEVGSPEELEEYLSRCGAVIVTFYSPTCPYCKAFAPVYAIVSREYPRVPFLRVNTWALPEVARELDIMAVPTTIGFARGRPVAVLYGYAGPERLEELVEETLRHASCEPGEGEA